eukprot:CAMPEP_0195087082 /NCGR_PEP_ID=MMETSP0448-20130528/27030_1 /TAXON_ID=66468 /ORGANISM="Heterocapsa triquestra, Strain CCMP 448" /LENGTH=349 /DNA_ID=CAMNT_0040120617 /DNA_START=1 /DNA_END=1046 /DNA_ORIENTATION=-
MMPSEPAPGRAAREAAAHEREDVVDDLLAVRLVQDLVARARVDDDLRPALARLQQLLLYVMVGGCPKVVDRDVVLLAGEDAQGQAGRQRRVRGRVLQPVERLHRRDPKADAQVVAAEWIADVLGHALRVPVEPLPACGLLHAAHGRDGELLELVEAQLIRDLRYAMGAVDLVQKGAEGAQDWLHDRREARGRRAEQQPVHLGTTPANAELRDDCPEAVAEEKHGRGWPRRVAGRDELAEVGGHARHRALGPGRDAAQAQLGGFRGLAVASRVVRDDDEALGHERLGELAVAAAVLPQAVVHVQHGGRLLRRGREGADEDLRAVAGLEVVLLGLHRAAGTRPGWPRFGRR